MIVEYVNGEQVPPRYLRVGRRVPIGDTPRAGLELLPLPGVAPLPAPGAYVPPARPVGRRKPTVAGPCVDCGAPRSAWAERCRRCAQQARQSRDRIWTAPRSAAPAQTEPAVVAVPAPAVAPVATPRKRGTCPDCGTPTAQRVGRCAACGQKARRAREGYAARACPDCSAPVSEYGRRCQSCANRAAWGARKAGTALAPAPRPAPPAAAVEPLDRLLRRLAKLYRERALVERALPAQEAAIRALALAALEALS